MQHLYCACVVAPLSATLEKVLWMWHLELPEMKVEFVAVALLIFLNMSTHQCRRRSRIGLIDKHFVVDNTGGGLVEQRPGVLSKVIWPDLVLGERGL